METLSDTITRLRKELSTARTTRDRIEKTGQSSSFGGIAFASAAYDQVLKRVGRLERDLFNAEAMQAGSDVRANVTLVKVSQS